MSRAAAIVPTLCRALDYVAIGLLLLSLTVNITGGFREWAPWGRISVTSWVRPLVIALLVLGARHWLQPRPTIVERIRQWFPALARQDAARAVLPLFIASRAGVILVGFLAVALLGYRADVPVPWRIYENEFLNLPARWDTGWYIGIAIDGYQWVPARTAIQQNITFFPLYPMLMRYGSLLLGRELLWTGVLISWLSFFGALIYLYRFARERFGADAAQAAAALLACYPFALYFSTAYTESLFLLTVVGACYHFERNELWAAGFWGLLAGLARPNGCLLSVVLALIALRPSFTGPMTFKTLVPATTSALRNISWARVADRIAVAALPGIGMLAYSTFIYFLTGDPLRWASQNAAWGRVYRGLDLLFAEQAQIIGDHGIYSYASTRTVDSLHLMALVFVAATLWPVGRRLGLPYAVMLAVNVVPPLLMGGLISIGRVTAVLFPAFVWLGFAIPPSHRAAWIAVFAMLQAVCAAVFFTWRPLF
jgi:Mannosyltransferase (PIG-V)